jgi:hypothetical protein
VLLYIGLSVMSVQINQVGYCHTGLLWCHNTKKSRPFVGYIPGSTPFFLQDVFVGVEHICIWWISQINKNFALFKLGRGKLNSVFINLNIYIMLGHTTSSTAISWHVEITIFQGWEKQLPSWFCHSATAVQIGTNKNLERLQICSSGSILFELNLS